jgi:hypothetical protein
MADRFTKMITMRLLRGKMTHDEASRALRDPETYKKNEKERSLVRDLSDGSTRNWPPNYYQCGLLKMPRKRVRYCYAKHRNSAGYFLGWRETLDANGSIKSRDQFVARKTKWRLKELQHKRTNALIDKGAIGKRVP